MAHFSRAKSSESSLASAAAAVWKALQPLEDQGFPIHRVRGKGYRIPLGAVLLDSAAIQAALPPPLEARWEWHLYQQIDSTNAQAQRLIAGSGRAAAGGCGRAANRRARSARPSVE